LRLIKSGKRKEERGNGSRVGCAVKERKEEKRSREG
jgi:hypothetical protein